MNRTFAGIAHKAVTLTASTLAIGALSLGLTAGTAHADERDGTAPATYTAQPATTFMLSGGYFAADNCHYYAQGGSWILDACYRPVADGQGGTIPGGLGIYPVQTDYTFGTPLALFKVDDPTWLYVRIPAHGSTVEIHARTLKADTRVLEVEATTADGAKLWIKPAQTQTPTTMGGNALNPAEQAQLAQLQRDWNNADTARINRWLQPACNSSYNGCR